MATRPTMGKPEVLGRDGDWYSVKQDGVQYRISEQDYQGHMRAWADYEDTKERESRPQQPSAPMGGGGNFGGGFGGSASFGGGGFGAGSSGGIFSQAAAAADPFSAQRGQYQTALSNLMQGGVSAIASDPSVQARMKAGTDAVGRSAAAQGYLGSGNILQALQEKGQEIASQEYGNQFERLSKLAGVDAGSPAAAGSIMAQAPGQALNEARFGLDQQRFGLDQQQLGAQSQMSAIEQQMLQQQLGDMQLASRQKIAGLEQQVNAPIQYQSGTVQGGMWAPDRPQYSYADPRSLPGNYLTNGGQTIDQILASRRAQVGLR
jgi:hypothetical protein